jgi:fucose 4-O-acetylase-like acetyltransferase
LEITTLSFNFTNIDIAFFRLFVGLCGSLFWFMLFELIYRNNGFFICLKKIGTITLAIYILQTIIYNDIICRYARMEFQDVHLWIYTLLVTPLISLIVLGVCIGIIRIVERNKYAELLLFGKIKTS